MSANIETHRSEVQLEQTKVPEYTGNTLRFEGINIQMDKGLWQFGAGEEHHTIDTYSIWNPAFHDEISDRFQHGERAASYIMGNFGVVEVRRPEEKTYDAMFDSIKRRPRSQNFVAFVNPDDIIDYIDIDKLPKELQNLRWAGARNDVYAGPMHAVFPLRKNAEIDKGLIRSEDNTLAAFWIPGHWGYEELGNRLRKSVKRGMLGGGSLNVHGKEPCYTTKDLYSATAGNIDWQEEIDFVLFDEIAEAGKIGRSQTMVSYSQFPAEVLRVGSISTELINAGAPYEVVLDKEKYNTGEVRRASSLTQYNRRTNETADKRVGEVMQRIDRYKRWYKNSFGKEHSTFHLPSRHPRPQAT
jgi:tRNA A37 threonylcarbamoyladenosine synthetase subunit TsaC/SUA5/YrdC